VTAASRAASWLPASMRLRNNGRMSLGNVVTVLVTLVAVLLGGLLSVLGQDRLSRREHLRQWRDIRLKAYEDFLSAYREFIAFSLEPTAKITAAPHPRHRGEMMPYFDETGRRYNENLSSARMTVSLVAERPETTEAMSALVLYARTVAASRTSLAPDEIDEEAFLRLFAAHDQFVRAARQELGLPLIPSQDRRQPPSPVSPPP
jgi:hypothetical protein